MSSYTTIEKRWDKRTGHTSHDPQCCSPTPQLSFPSAAHIRTRPTTQPGTHCRECHTGLTGRRATPPSVSIFTVLASPPYGLPISALAPPSPAYWPKRLEEQRLDVLLQQLGQVHEELGGLGAVDVSVVAGDGDRHLLLHADEAVGLCTTRGDDTQDDSSGHPPIMTGNNRHDK